MVLSVMTIIKDIQPLNATRILDAEVGAASSSARRDDDDNRVPQFDSPGEVALQFYNAHRHEPRISISFSWPILQQ